jgi:aspartate/methionine/tyrosine aminotransferase
MSTQWISDRVSGLVPSATIAIGDRIQRLREAGHEITNLISGAAEFDTPAAIKAAARSALEEDYRYMTYTDSAGLPELRQAITAKLARENGIEADTGDIIVTVGVKEGVALATQACLGSGDEVLLPTPAWVTYEHLIRLTGATPVSIPLREGADFPPSRAEMAARVSPCTRAILFNTPHNPTGHVYRRHELEAIADLAQRHDLLVLVDETLEYLIYSDVPHLSIAALPGMAERTLTFNGFSKAFCMTGWRLGYSTGPSTVIENMLKVHQHLVTCANAVAQKAAVTALTGSQEGRHAIYKRLLTRRDIMVAALNRIPGVTCPTPEAGLFCFPDISAIGMTDRDFVDFCLEEAKVACLAGSMFGDGGGGHVRIAFGKRSTDDLQAAVERIGRALAGRSGRIVHVGGHD